MNIVFGVPRIKTELYSLITRVLHIHERSRLELQQWLSRFKQELFRCSGHQLWKITGKNGLAVGMVLWKAAVLIGRVGGYVVD